jgi:hypothetical protein
MTTKRLKSDVKSVIELPSSSQIKGGELNTNQLTYAKLASSAYEKANSPNNIDGYICDRSFGQANSSVYYNEDLKEVVLSIRGTDKTNPEDLVNDANILVGSIPKTRRFNELRQRLAQIISKYKDYKVVLVGHSLGGRLSQELLLKYPNYIDSAHVFNSGSSLDVAVKGLFCKFRETNECRIMKQKLHIYSVPGDLLSFLSRYLPSKTLTTETNSSLNPIEQHTMANFTGSGIFSLLNLDDLKLIAKQKGIKSINKLSKDQLIEKLNQFNYL